MSDMYLVLRHRLETVATQWVPIETAVLRAARTRLGLSYESLARQIPVAAKTYERWEKAGRVPVGTVEKLAGLLELEIERPTFEQPVVMIEATKAGQIDELRADLAELRQSQARMEEMLAEALGKRAQRTAQESG
jgi:transcriptional regulator with XRE-family HTH domain